MMPAVSAIKIVCENRKQKLYRVNRPQGIQISVDFCGLSLHYVEAAVVVSQLDFGTALVLTAAVYEDAQLTHNCPFYSGSDKGLIRKAPAFQICFLLSTSLDVDNFSSSIKNATPTFLFLHFIRVHFARLMKCGSRDTNL